MGPHKAQIGPPWLCLGIYFQKNCRRQVIFSVRITSLYIAIYKIVKNILRCFQKWLVLSSEGSVLGRLVVNLHLTTAFLEPILISVSQQMGNITRLIQYI